jgi:peptidoglycan hydrolase-like protein with peptidoglycan-binding domain
MDIRSILNRLDYLTEEIAPRNGAWLGDNIGKIQQGLVDLNFPVGTKGVDSNFGPDTAAAVRAFQQANPPLVVDGDPGPETVAVMNKLLGDPSRPKTGATDPAAQKNPEDAKKLDELVTALEKLVPISLASAGGAGALGAQAAGGLAKVAGAVTKTPLVRTAGKFVGGPVASGFNFYDAYNRAKEGDYWGSFISGAAGALNFMGLTGKAASVVLNSYQGYEDAIKGKFGNDVKEWMLSHTPDMFAPGNKEKTNESSYSLRKELALMEQQLMLDPAIFEAQQLDEGAWDNVKQVAAKLGKTPNWVLNTGMIIYESYQASKDLPKPANPNDAGSVARYKSKLAKIWSKVIAEFGIFVVGAYFGALIGAPFGGIPGMLVGLLGGMAGGLALQHAFGNKPEELVNYIIDVLYPEGSSVNPVDSTGKISSTGAATGSTSVPAAKNKPSLKPAQYTDPDKEARYQNWLKTQEGAF